MCKKERLCEEYIENPEGFNYCHWLFSSDETKRCAYINNKCIEHYKNCKDYTGNDSKECESIEPFDETNYEPYFNKKCVFEEGKCIIKEKTSCSEYKSGYDKEACSMIQLKDENKICVLLADKCIETYKTCGDYKGDNEDICKSIIPTYEKDGFYNIDNELKCSLINNTCVSTERYCSEYIFNNRKYCDYLKTKDENKICFDYKGKCIESYEFCEDYNQNVDKETCENIIPQSYHYDKCVYDSENKKCISEHLPCSSYQVDSIGEQCRYLGIENNIKCEYSNGTCLAEHTEDDDGESNQNEGGNFEFRKMILILFSLLIL